MKSFLDNGYAPTTNGDSAKYVYSYAFDDSAIDPALTSYLIDASQALTPALSYTSTFYSTGKISIDESSLSSPTHSRHIYSQSAPQPPAPLVWAPTATPMPLPTRTNRSARRGCKLCPHTSFKYAPISPTRPSQDSLERHVLTAHPEYHFNWRALDYLWGHRVSYSNKTYEDVMLPQWSDDRGGSPRFEVADLEKVFGRTKRRRWRVWGCRMCPPLQRTGEGVGMGERERNGEGVRFFRKDKAVKSKKKGRRETALGESLQEHVAERHPEVMSWGILKVVWGWRVYDDEGRETMVYEPEGYVEGGQKDKGVGLLIDMGQDFRVLRSEVIGQIKQLDGAEEDTGEVDVTRYINYAAADAAPLE